MRAERLVALLITAGIILAACAEEGEPGEPPAPPAPDSPVSTTGPGAEEPTPEPGPLIVAPRSGLVDVGPRPWAEIVTLGSGRLEVRFWSGVEECYGLDRVEVDETAEAVTITLFEGRVPEAEVCIEIAVLKAVRVSLDAPLAGREILDGAAG